MNFEIIRASDTKTSAWSGGTTREIYIYPEGSEFKKLNFDFRLSIATVEVEESIFTSLSGVNRTLMVLEGEIKLIHEDHHETHLHQFEQDSFKGDWKTKSVGKVTDFNLMYMNETKGILKHFRFSENQALNIKLLAKKELFYLYKGNLSFKNETLNEGDLIVFDNKTEKIKFTQNNSEVDLIQISIF
jgi:uncharacterized protein